jgi:hypothetical protein
LVSYNKSQGNLILPLSIGFANSQYGQDDYYIYQNFKKLTATSERQFVPATGREGQ